MGVIVIVLTWPVTVRRDVTGVGDHDGVSTMAGAGGVDEVDGGGGGGGGDGVGDGVGDVVGDGVGDVVEVVTASGVTEDVEDCWVVVGAAEEVEGA